MPNFQMQMEASAHLDVLLTCCPNVYTFGQITERWIIFSAADTDATIGDSKKTTLRR